MQQHPILVQHPQKHLQPAQWVDCVVQCIADVDYVKVFLRINMPELLHVTVPAALSEDLKQSSTWKPVSRQACSRYMPINAEALWKAVWRREASLGSQLPVKPGKSITRDRLAHCAVGAHEGVRRSHGTRPKNKHPNHWEPPVKSNHTHKKGQA